MKKRETPKPKVCPHLHKIKHTGVDYKGRVMWWCKDCQKTLVEGVDVHE